MFSIHDIHVPLIHLFAYKNRTKSATFKIVHVILKLQKQKEDKISNIKIWIEHHANDGLWLLKDIGK